MCVLYTIQAGGGKYRMAYAKVLTVVTWGEVGGVAGKRESKGELKKKKKAAIRNLKILTQWSRLCTVTGVGMRKEIRKEKEQGIWFSPLTCRGALHGASSIKPSWQVMSVFLTRASNPLQVSLKHTGEPPRTEFLIQKTLSFVGGAWEFACLRARWLWCCRSGEHILRNIGFYHELHFCEQTNNNNKMYVNGNICLYSCMNKEKIWENTY